MPIGPMELEDMISTDDAYVTGNADPILHKSQVVSLSLIIKIRTTFDKVTF